LLLVSEIARDGASVVPASRDAPLLEMYFFGFITLFVLGISIRVLPHFLSLRPPQVRYFTPALHLRGWSRVGSGWRSATQVVNRTGAARLCDVRRVSCLFG
jgi:hypothetical protein